MNEQYIGIVNGDNLDTYLQNFKRAKHEKEWNVAVGAALGLAFYYRAQNDLINATDYMAKAAKCFSYAERMKVDNHPIMLDTHLEDQNLIEFFAPFNTRVPLGHIITNQAIMPNNPVFTPAAGELDLTPYGSLNGRQRLEPVTVIEVQATAKALTVNTSINTLKLNFNQITDVGGLAIAEMLKTNYHIHTVDFSMTRITDETLEKLAEIVKINFTLKEIYLGWNDTTEEGTTTLMRAILAQNTSVETLSFDWDVFADEQGTLAAALQNNTTLTSLGELSVSEDIYALITRNVTLKPLTTQLHAALNRIETAVINPLVNYDDYLDRQNLEALIQARETARVAGYPQTSVIYQKINSTIMLMEIYQAYHNHNAELAFQKISLLTNESMRFHACQKILSALVHVLITVYDPQETSVQHITRLSLTMKLLGHLTPGNAFKSGFSTIIHHDFNMLQRQYAAAKGIMINAHTQEFHGYSYQPSFTAKENTQSGAVDDNGLKPLGCRS